MLKLLPILLAAAYAVFIYRLSQWRTKRELDRNSTELADARLLHAASRLAATLDLSRVRVFIHEVEAINGLAAPDGRVFITRGFYRKFLDGSVSADELVSVIAHELGHVALGHTRRRMIDFSGQNAMRAALAIVLSRFLPWVGAWIANGLTSLLAARLSRNDEYAADAFAAALLHKAGIGTGPQKSLLGKIEVLTRASTGMVPAWFLSHPPPANRIKAIERLEAGWRS